MRRWGRPVVWSAAGFGAALCLCPPGAQNGPRVEVSWYGTEGRPRLWIGWSRVRPGRFAPPGLTYDYSIHGDFEGGFGLLKSESINFFKPPRYYRTTTVAAPRWILLVPPALWLAGLALARALHAPARQAVTSTVSPGSNVPAAVSPSPNARSR